MSEYQKVGALWRKANKANPLQPRYAGSIEIPVELLQEAVANGTPLKLTLSCSPNGYREHERQPDYIVSLYLPETEQPYEPF